MSEKESAKNNIEVAAEEREKKEKGEKKHEQRSESNEGVQSFADFMKQLDSLLQEYLVKKAPAIPDRWREIIVQIIPILNLVSFLITVPIVITFFGLSSLLFPFLVYADRAGGLTSFFSVLLTIPGLVFNGLAIPGLFKRTKQSWMYIYYATLWFALANIIQFNIVGLILGSLLSLYILYQVRGYYKK